MILTAVGATLPPCCPQHTTRPEVAKSVAPSVRRAQKAHSLLAIVSTFTSSGCTVVDLRLGWPQVPTVLSNFRVAYPPENYSRGWLIE